jgi:DNA mismatch endonuclease, patch repair protein
MADIVSREVRSRMMSGIRGKNTKPEMLIRKELHRLGFRYRLHVKSLPGKPDIVLPRYRAAIFVHGCFWHGHDCHLFKWPKSRCEFWKAKIERNRELDSAANNALEDMGWRQATIWECAIKGRRQLQLETVIQSCTEWLESDQPSIEIKGC